MRVFLTGLTGFTGSHLAEHLVATGHEVGGLSRSGAWPAGVVPPPVTMFRGDLTRPGEIGAAVSAFAPDLVMHLAAFAAPSRAGERPFEVVRDTIEATVGLFEAVAVLPVRPAVLVSGSATAYGRVPEAEQPIREDRALRPISGYGAAKAAQELHAWQYRATAGLRVFLTRTFNTTGPRQPADFFLARLCREIARREAGRERGPIRVGDLAVHRDFLDVRDAVRAYVLLAACPAAEGVPVNVCSGTSVELGDISRRVVAQARVPVELAPDPGAVPASQDAVVAGDPARLITLTGFAPGIPLDATIADVLADQRARVAEG